MTATGPRLWAGLKALDQRPSTGATERYFSCWLAAARPRFLEPTERRSAANDPAGVLTRVGEPLSGFCIGEAPESGSLYPRLS